VEPGRHVGYAVVECHEGRQRRHRTSAPDKKLHVADTTTNSYPLKVSNGTAYNAASYNAIQLASNDAAANLLEADFALYGSATPGSRHLEINVYDANASAWRNIALANNGGNVGIGTASPGSKLDVNGGVQ